MTHAVPQTATTPPPAPAGDGAAAPGLFVRLARREPVALALVLVPAVGFLFMFWRWFVRQHQFSLEYPEDWGHAYIVPLVSAFYIWQRRKEIVGSFSRVFWPGLLVIALAIVTYLYFVFAFPNHMFQGFALVLGVAGIVMLLSGTRGFGVLFFPVAYLALGVTISEQVMNQLTWPLQQLAAAGGHMLLNLLQVDATRISNVITVYASDGSEIPLNVEEACSGMRMVIAFVALGAAVAFISCRFWWQRIALLLLTVPVALVMNIVRVAALGVAGLIDPDLAGGDSHTVIGTILLLPSLGVFMGFVWLLNRAVVDESASKKSAATKTKATTKSKSKTTIKSSVTTVTTTESSGAASKSPAEPKSGDKSKAAKPAPRSTKNRKRKGGSK